MKRLSTALLVLILFTASLAGCACAGSISYLKYGGPLPALGVENQLEVHVINVGTSDCILLRSGNQTMLVDCGLIGNSERVTAYLKAIGVNRLDYAFATHPHDDHIGGYVNVLEEVSVGELLWAPLYETYNSKYQRQLFALADEKGIPMRIIDNNTVMSLGGATLTFMQWQKKSASENNRSMMIMVQYSDSSILLAADVEDGAQKALVAEYGDKLRADIIKMPHHGIAPARKDFTGAVQASLGIITNVKNNIPDTVRTYEYRGITCMFATKGTIVAVTDGEFWDVWQIPKE